MNNITDQEKEKVKKFLSAIVTVRNLPLLFLGITTIAMIYPMANGWTAKNVGIGFVAGLLTNVITIIVYGAFDGSLELILKFIDGTKPKQHNKKFFYVVALMGCVALAGTGTLSIWSSPIIIALTSSNEDVTSDTKQLFKQKLDIEKTDKETKAKALESAINSKDARIANARKKAEALEIEAAKTTNESWRKDYLAAKNNPNHWFWTCKKGGGCPQGYIDYREGILAARSEGVNLIKQEENLISELSGNNTMSLDPSFIMLAQMAKTDSVIVAQNVALDKNKTKALILVELSCLFLVLFFTIIIQIGKVSYKIELDGEFITLFSALEMGIMKILNVLFALYKVAIDAIDAQKVQDFTANLVSVTVSAGSNWVGGKLKETRQKLAIIEEQKQALELEKEEARKKAEEARQALELEKEQLRQALEKERLEKETENARIEREKLEKEALERAKIEAERQRALELEREKVLKNKTKKPKQNKALYKDSARKIEKKEKDRILNSIRYQFDQIKTLDQAKDSARIAEHKARINEILADKVSGIAYLENNGYYCIVDFENYKVSARLQ